MKAVPQDAELFELAERLVGDAARAGLRIGIAESCTGGLVGGAVTAVAGSSTVFTGGVVAYENRVKEAVLGVPGEVLARHGAVSSPVAEAMARGVRDLLRTDVGAGITGIAGPSGGSADRPVGLVFIATCGVAGNCSVVRFRFTGGRDAVRRQTVRAALELLNAALTA